MIPLGRFLTPVQTLFTRHYSSHLVFVYGTLKRGEPNHPWMNNKKNGRAQFLFEGLTIRKYPLVIATKYNIPFLLYKPGTGHYIHGEVYKVDDKMLHQLDAIEDHPNYYTRDEDLVKHKDKPTKIKCWVYFMQNFKPRVLDLPRLDSYSSTGSHGLVYMKINKDTGMDDLKDIKIA